MQLLEKVLCFSGFAWQQNEQYRIKGAIEL